MKLRIVLVLACAITADSGAMLSKTHIFYKKNYPIISFQSLRFISNHQRAQFEKKALEQKQRELVKTLSKCTDETEISYLKEKREESERYINGLPWTYADVGTFDSPVSVSPDNQILATAQPVTLAYGYEITIKKRNITSDSVETIARRVFTDLKSVESFVFIANNCLVITGQTYTNKKITKVIQALPQEQKSKWSEKLLPAGIVSLWIASFALDVVQFFK